MFSESEQIQIYSKLRDYVMVIHGFFLHPKGNVTAVWMKKKVKMRNLCERKSKILSSQITILLVLKLLSTIDNNIRYKKFN